MKNLTNSRTLCKECDYKVLGFFTIFSLCLERALFYDTVVLEPNFDVTMGSTNNETLLWNVCDCAKRKAIEKNEVEMRILSHNLMQNNMDKSLIIKISHSRLGKIEYYNTVGFVFLLFSLWLEHVRFNDSVLLLVYCDVNINFN